MRLTVAQALVRFLAAQYSERDGQEHRLVQGCLGIFGHGNVAGVGQALLQAELATPSALPYILGRNEQGMVHTAAGFARMRNRLATLAVTTSIGPGATNMVTGAALATINRLPVVLLPGDVFATRAANPLLQELEDPRGYDVSVNDAFVMDAWGKSSGAAGKVRMLADGNGEFTRAMGLELDASGFGMGKRSQRYGMVVRDGKVEQLHVEPGPGLNVCSAESILGKL